MSGRGRQRQTPEVRDATQALNSAAADVIAHIADCQVCWAAKITHKASNRCVAGHRLAATVVLKREHLAAAREAAGRELSGQGELFPELR